MCDTNRALAKWRGGKRPIPQLALTEEQVRKIFLDPAPQIEIAKREGLLPSTVSLIKARRNYRYWTEDL